MHKQAEGNFDISVCKLSPPPSSLSTYPSLSSSSSSSIHLCSFQDLVDNGLCTAAEADQISQATKASMPSLVWAWTMHGTHLFTSSLHLLFTFFTSSYIFFLLSSETKNLLLLKKISPECEGALIGMSKRKS